MANALKGEVEVTIEGTAYTLCFTTNSIAQVEQLFGGESIGAIARQMVRVEYQRALLWAALQKNHDKVDLLQAGALMDDYEAGPGPLMEAVARALRFRLSRTPLDAPLVEQDDE